MSYDLEALDRQLLDALSVGDTSRADAIDRERAKLLPMAGKPRLATEPQQSQYTEDMPTGWQIEQGLAEPSAPRDFTDKKARENYLSELSLYSANLAMKALSAKGFTPGSHIRAFELASVIGNSMAQSMYQRARIADLESRFNSREFAQISQRTNASELSNQFVELSRRVEAMEKTATVFRGSYQRAQSYKRGSLVGHQGGLWCAVTDAKQGDAPPGACWQLCVKRGAVE